MADLVYLDSAASAPLAPEALAATVDALTRVGNPGAAHVPGVEAAQLVERARQVVGELTYAGSASVIFTASATEANNLAIRGVSGSHGRGTIVTTTSEHPSVLATAGDAGRSTAGGTRIVPVGADGQVDLTALESALACNALMVSIQAANNETGVIQPLEEVVDLAHMVGALVHVDASQLMAWGQAKELAECDLVTVSSHKMHGPQGAAALIVRSSARPHLRPLITGGGQERGMRSGTLNVAAIAGFGAAAALALESGKDAAIATATRRTQLLDGLVSGIGDVIEHGTTGTWRLPGILNVALGVSDPLSVESEALLSRVPDIAASTGSACHSGAPGPSPVLLAMGVSEWEAARSIRLSLSRYTTDDDIANARRALVDGYRELARLLGGREQERYVQ